MATVTPPISSLLSLTKASARIDGKPVLEGVTFRVEPGQCVALCGPNGAGKSSAIRALLGLLPLTQGGATAAGDPVHGVSDAERSSRMAYLPQDGRIAWNMPAVEIAALGAPLLASDIALSRARAALDAVGAGHLVDRGVADMSGGERARVLLARLLVTEARALIVDEPVAGLDPDAQLLVLDRLKAWAVTGQAVLASLHDLTLAARWADRIVVIQSGRVVADDVPMLSLSPDILARVFGLDGRWIETASGPLLDARRRQ